MLEHGGKIRDAALRYNIPLSDWVDLSTGINPNGWLPKNISTDAWNRLPEKNDGLIKAAQQYYRCDSLLPIAGSQAAIQILPKILFSKNTDKKNIAVLSPAYEEHAHAWKKYGHNVIPVTSEQIEEKIDALDTLVIINPNNPTGELFPPQRLINWHTKIAKRNGWLIVDEAFMDCSQEHSILSQTPRENVIILRSIGKFFGLAGIRVGFVSAPHHILNQLDETLGPWTISGPSRLCAQQALNDHQWQCSNNTYLHSASKRLITLLTQFQLTPDGSTSLFSWVKTKNAKEIHEKLTKAGILTRLFSEPSSLRFGLPKDEKQWVRLTQALENIT